MGSIQLPNKGQLGPWNWWLWEVIQPVVKEKHLLPETEMGTSRSRDLPQMDAPMYKGCYRVNK